MKMDIRIFTIVRGNDTGTRVLSFNDSELDEILKEYIKKEYLKDYEELELVVYEDVEL